MLTRELVTQRRPIAQVIQGRSGMPNVLLLILDTVRASSLSAYGYTRPTTTELERLAGHGVLFETAVSTSPWTLPSHASMFTGRYPHELQATWNTALEATYPTLAEQLSRVGYRTGGFVANLSYGAREFGLARGFEHYEDYPRTLAYSLSYSNLVRFAIATVNRLTDRYYSPSRKLSRQVSSGFLQWLTRHPDRPYFAFLNYYCAHDPYAPPAPFHRQFAAQEPPTRRVNTGRHTAEEVRGLQDAYDGAVAYVDSEIGRLYDELKRRGQLDNTLIIITSDHGEEFGEHGQLGHGNSLYLPSLHVPLLVLFPGRVPQGVRVPQAVTLRDLPATIVDLLGLADTLSFPGHSLRPTWDATGNAASGVSSPLISQVEFARNLPSWYPISRGDMKSIVVDPYHYIRNGDGTEELYDIRKDPWQRQPLTGSDQIGPVLDSLRQQLDRIYGAARYSDQVGDRRTSAKASGTPAGSRR
jgi:arylsulfatase A-like enzyme